MRVKKKKEYKTLTEPSGAYKLSSDAVYISLTYWESRQSVQTAECTTQRTIIASTLH